jgi:hypothetical protein
MGTIVPRALLARAKAQAPQLPAARLRLEVGAPVVSLRALDVAPLLLEDRLSQGMSKAIRMGVTRPAEVRAGDGAWTELADGRNLWVVEVESPGAAGLRLHFVEARLPARGQLAIGTPDAEQDAWRAAHPELRGASAPRAFWTGTVAGERLRVEYLAPAGGGRELPFRIDALVHLYRSPSDLWEKDPAGPCHNDVTCYPEYEALARAVNGIGALDYRNGNALFCTGQLLNDVNHDLTPYELTANHCETQSEPGAIEIFWMYQTTSCGGGRPPLGNSPRSLGTTVVAQNPLSDFTLLLIDGTVPIDQVAYAGWNAKAVPAGAPTVAVHHPNGDFKRISFGEVNPDATNCSVTGPIQWRGKKLIRNDWTDGPTEVGSSGSLIALQSTQQILGQLLGGPSACGVQPQSLYDCYGAFSSTYANAAVKKALQGGSDDKSEQNDSCRKARVLKAGSLPARIVKLVDTDWFKVNVPAHKQVRVRADFVHGNGDIDLEGFASCTGAAVATSTGTGDEEELVIANNGSKPAWVYVHVYLTDDVRNGYNLSTAIQAVGQ